MTWPLFDVCLYWVVAKMIVLCQCKVGALVTPKVDERDLGWSQYMLSKWSILECLCYIAQVCLEVI